ncbi:hypothetical protein FQV39_05785 [Bosea sp. F3-2]|uniref:hypothetical protein n=1 Tax=Bosea sp. F3-2 TaxID=2599640 RepID=UPI0011ED8A56|nr:hypothetical protein [Bosea sp. F3-2]QEL22127.1 hypothetical protein FQV39_05785 [Bosea sp. F3-2]
MAVTASAAALPRLSLGEIEDQRLDTLTKGMPPGAALRLGDVGKQGGLEPALEVWAYVQSRPERGRRLLNLRFLKGDVGTCIHGVDHVGTGTPEWHEVAVGHGVSCRYWPSGESPVAV